MDGMENIKAFFGAALTWLTMGIVIAIFAARSVASEKNSKKSEDNYGAEGMCIGMSFGTALGATFGDHAGLGLSLGMLVGLAIGSCIQKTQGGNVK